MTKQSKQKVKHFTIFHRDLTLQIFQHIFVDFFFFVEFNDLNLHYLKTRKEALEHIKKFVI